MDGMRRTTVDGFGDEIDRMLDRSLVSVIMVR
jgi:hypothetical protein